MPHWMVHPQHGTMPVYSMSEVTQVQAHGWTLLNTGESPNLPPKVKAEPSVKWSAEADAGAIPHEWTAQAPSGPEAPVSAPAAPPMPTEPVAAPVAPAKRKPGRPPKVK